MSAGSAPLPMKLAPIGALAAKLALVTPSRRAAESKKSLAFCNKCSGEVIRINGEGIFDGQFMFAHWGQSD